MAGQKVLQPIVAKGDTSLNRREVLHTVAVAHARSVNQRAVGRCKMPQKMIKSGCGEQTCMGYGPRKRKTEFY
jgi:hypothetical protein